MFKKGRRGRLLSLLVLAVVICAACGVFAYAGRTERIARYWAVAQVDSSGEANITEQIDYDFGSHTRHGIFRIVPGLLNDPEHVSVNSPDAPDDVDLSAAASGTEIRIGDPSTTVAGQHRYTIKYQLSSLARGNTYAWNVQGTDWNVGAKDVTGTLITPYDMTDLRCAQGTSGSQTACSVDQPEPGKLVLHATNLKAHEGVTVYATKGSALGEVPTARDAPTDTPSRDGMNPPVPALVGLIAALVGMAITGPRLIKAGREHVSEGGAADAAYADDSAAITQRVDTLDLEKMTTTEFASPKGLTPSQGGVLLKESVTNDHKAAWMMQADIDGFLDVSGTGKDIVIKTNAKDGYASPVLDAMFNGRDMITLKKYDPVFASGWNSIGSELESWRKSSGLWDPKGESNKTSASVFGGLAVVGGAIIGGVGAFFAGGHGPIALPAVALGALACGAGSACFIYVNGLRMRTAKGSGLWLRTESFRRFLAVSEAQHVERAAGYGQLREYTAWAVALGEVGRWTSAMNSASLPAGSYNANDAAFYTAAPFFASAASSASTAPSSSSGGGGGSGAGGGGGGGGSW